MSPKIGLGINVSPWMDRPNTSREKVRVAIAHMDAQGIKILQGDPGVRRAGLAGGWEIDPLRRPGPAVNLTGAVLLAYQAIASEDEDLCAVAARECGTQMLWCCGLDDGWDGGVPNAYYLQSFQRALYWDGYETGRRILHDHTVKCSTCGSVYLASAQPCPWCEENEIVSREKGAEP